MFKLNKKNYSINISCRRKCRSKTKKSSKKGATTLITEAYKDYNFRLTQGKKYIYNT